MTHEDIDLMSRLAKSSGVAAGAAFGGLGAATGFALDAARRHEARRVGMVATATHLWHLSPREAERVADALMHQWVDARGLVPLGVSPVDAFNRVVSSVAMGADLYDVVGIPRPRPWVRLARWWRIKRFNLRWWWSTRNIVIVDDPSAQTYMEEPDGN